MRSHTVAVAAYVDDVAVMQKPVDGGDSHHLVAQHAAPLSSKPLFEVSTVEARLWRALMSWKKSTPPSWLTGK